MDKQITFSPLIVGTMRLGAWGANYNTNQYETFIEGCINLGLTDMDHADIYGHYTTEKEFGAVMKRRPDLKDKVEITTKCGILLPSENRPTIQTKQYDLSKKHIIKSVLQSIDNLGVDRIKLLLLHRPDYLLEIDEIASAFDELKSKGLVEHFGVSNFTTTQFDQLNKAFPLANNQIEFSLQNSNAMLSGEFDYYKKNQLLSAWSPLGGGALLQENHPIKTTLENMAAHYNCSAVQLLYAWIWKHPIGITPVTGTSKLERIKEALDAKSIQLSRQDWYTLLEKSRGKCVD